MTPSRSELKTTRCGDRVFDVTNLHRRIQVLLRRPGILATDEIDPKYGRDHGHQNHEPMSAQKLEHGADLGTFGQTSMKPTRFGLVPVVNL